MKDYAADISKHMMELFPDEIENIRCNPPYTFNDTWYVNAIVNCKTTNLLSEIALELHEFLCVYSLASNIDHAGSNLYATFAPDDLNGMSND